MVSGGLAKAIEAVKETTGIDITEIMKANTYDAKVNRNLNVTGLDPSVPKKQENTEEADWTAEELLGE